MLGTNTARLMSELQSRQTPAPAAEVFAAAGLEPAARVLAALSSVGLLESHGPKNARRWSVTAKGAAWRAPAAPELASDADRAARAKTVAELRAFGFTNLEVADALGLARRAASELYTDADGAKLRARHDRSKKGTCAVCGGPKYESSNPSPTCAACVSLGADPNDRRQPPRNCDTCGIPQSRWRHPEELVCGPCARTAGEPVSISGRLGLQGRTATTATILGRVSSRAA